MAAVPSYRPSQDDKVWVEVLSWKPRALAYHNFLSKEVRLSALLDAGYRDQSNGT